MIVGLDPGKAKFGWAVMGAGGQIISTGVCRGADMLDYVDALATGSWWPTSEVLIETPAKKWGRTRDRDILAVAVTAGALKHACRGAGSVTLVEPRRWKGTMDGDAMTAAILRRLTPAERAIVDACGVPRRYLHDAVDAIGICLWRAGRLR